MSSCVLFTVNKNGDVEETHQFKNSWGGAALIWEYFTEKYFPLPPGKKRWETGIGMGCNLQPVWDLWKRKDLPEAERIVMMSTFDNVMVKKEDLNKLANCFEEVEKDMHQYCVNFYTRASHIKSQANVFRIIAQDPNALAVCWQQTTCADNPWFSYPEKPENFNELTEEEQWEFEEGKTYNVNIGSKHWYLFDEFNKYNVSNNLIK